MRVVGHEVFYDNMGLAGLTHPVACRLVHSGTDCRVAHALIHGEVVGYDGKGTYLAALDLHEPKVVHLHHDAQAMKELLAPEIEVVLDEYLIEVSRFVGMSGMVDWLRKRGAIL